MEKTSHSVDESGRLFLQARAGDESALWRLTEQLRPYLKGLIRKTVGPEFASKVDDSDVLQQSMLRAVDKFSEFQGQNVAQWQAWLVTIAQNEARNSMRFWRQQRRDAYRDRPDHAVPTQGLAADQSSPSQIVMRRERAARLMATIGQLTEEQQQLIGWRHFDNLPHKEIAQRLNISEAAVRQRWKSVLDKLGHLWEQANGG